MVLSETRFVTSPYYLYRFIWRIQMQSHDYAVGWGTLALINAGLAQGKDRSGLLWFLLSLLLGPVATVILVAFVPKDRIIVL